jgi:hypothetical protein
VRAGGASDRVVASRYPPYPDSAWAGTKVTAPTFRDSAPRVIAAGDSSAIACEQLRPPRLMEAGTESNQPLVLAVVGGLTSSTILSLFLVPVMFLLVAKRPAAEPALPSREGDPVPLLQPS